MSPIEFSASQFIVRRGAGATIIAGYPWFTDWGRDTFIALRGLCLALGKIDEARTIIETWADAAENGLLPNCFCDDRDTPDYHSADTSLWFVIAANEVAQEFRRAKRSARAFEARVRKITDAILARYMRGTDFGVRVDDDGLVIAGGSPGHALTWMDACVHGAAVTPRIGKPIEVQCLWVNALETARRRSPEISALLKTARRSFVNRFWRADRGYLADVADAGLDLGAEDESLRPNQIFAVGGLPHALVPKPMARQVVEAVHRELYTPLGLRTLGPGDPAYRGRYAGGSADRDSAYHQGTVWPWLMGPFGEAHLRVHDATPSARDWVRTHCLAPLRTRLETVGFGHLPEIANGDSPHAVSGCPFQAWSLGEFLRLERLCGAE
jgi:predicted glycogen debranching enzyme